MSRQPSDPIVESRAEEAGETGFPPPELIYIKDHRAMCDGGGGALGHPRVYYEIGDEGYAECGYCDRRFVLEGGPADER